MKYSIACMLSILVSIVILFYAFTYIFFRKQTGESDIDVVARQLRGFALWLIAGSVSTLALVYCYPLKENDNLRVY
jgi:formate hydrogenlyase subunit 3/multisubunit Na+/H+ antiporter MnhD subunit